MWHNNQCCARAERRLFFLLFLEGGSSLLRPPPAFFSAAAWRCRVGFVGMLLFVRWAFLPGAPFVPCCFSPPCSSPLGIFCNCQWASLPPFGGQGGASLGPPKNAGKAGKAGEAGRRSPGGQGQVASTGRRWRPCRPEALYNVAGSSREGHLPSLDPAEGRRLFCFLRSPD